MSLIVHDVMRVMEEYAPSDLKESYDNVGLMVGDRHAEVTSILVALDCTLKVIDEAIQKNCNLIITHHPLLFRKPSSITSDTLQGKKILKLIQNNINLFSSHTNLDSVKHGINDIMLQILGFTNAKIIDSAKDYDESGIGRFVHLDNGMLLREIIQHIKEKLNLNALRYCGDDDFKIHNIAFINGSGQDYFEAARRLGAECIITGDTSYHYVSDFNEDGIAIIDAGHFETEWPAMSLIADYISNKINNFGCENKVILSVCNESPYKFK